MRNSLRSKYDESNDIFGKPQIYNNLKLYPIVLKDLKYYNLFYKLFTQPKHHIPDREILKSSFLKFILFIVLPSMGYKGDDGVELFKDLMRVLTKEKDIEILFRQLNGEGLSSIDIRLNISGTDYTEYQFDEMREIILEQNGLSSEYVDEYNPELESSLAFLNKDNEHITFQDEIFTFCSIMKITLREVEDYTVFQFNRHFEKLLTLKNYDLYQPLVISGQITLKSGEVKNFLYHSGKSGRYDSIKLNTEDFLKKNGEAFGSS